MQSAQTFLSPGDHTKLGVLRLQPAHQELGKGIHVIIVRAKRESGNLI
jgi:hypothetical protein